MVDKIVQLVDKDNNNVFPVAGSLKQGSVTTSTINDNAVTAGKIDFSTLSGNYSTSEVNTGFTWVDGRAIYKKTVSFGAAPNNTTKTIAHGISNLKDFIKFEGFCRSSTSGKYSTFPITPVDSRALMDFSADSTNLQMTTTDNRSAWNFTITLYYTKTS